MIDTINISKSVELSNDQIEATCDKLNNVSEVRSEFNEYTLQGYYRNLHVKASKTRIRITGSLNVFSKGNNSKLLLREDLEECLNELSGVLGVDVLEFQISRIDFGINILSNVDINMIKKYLITPQYTEFQPLKHGVRYKNSVREYSFYDKSKEIGSKYPIPPIFRTKHYIRVEYKLLKAESVQRFFNAQPTVHYLISNYDVLIEKFHAICSDIKWTNPDKVDHSTLLQGNNLKNFLLFTGVQALGGKQKIMELLAIAKSNDVTTYSNKISYLRKTLESIDGYKMSNKALKDIKIFTQMIDSTFTYSSLVNRL